MPNKDPKKRTEASKLRMQKMRKGVTKQGVTDEGVTRIEFIQQQLNNPFLVEGIESGAKVKDDIDLRYERAYIYKLKREGKVTGSVIGRGIDELRSMSEATGR